MIGYAARNQPVLCIVDPCLDGFVGHHYQYDRSTALAAAKQHYRPVILSLRKLDRRLSLDKFVQPTFRIGMWAPSGRYPEWSDDDVRACNQVFFDDLMIGIQNIPMRPDTIIFAHMITGRQLLAWAWFAEKYLGRNGPQLVLLLRYEKKLYHGKICQQAFHILERVAVRGGLRLASDSRRLAKCISTLTTLPVEEFSIPHTPEIEHDSYDLDQNSTARPLRLVSLGNARDEKGIFEILEAIQAIRQNEAFDRLEFVLQCNDMQPNVKLAVKAFSRHRLPGVQLIWNALNTKNYYKLLQSADIILLPYWRSVYSARTSGVFVEAVSTGRIVICTEDTWMSDELKLCGGGVLCRDRDPNNFVEAIGYAVSNYERLRTQAWSVRECYLARHNADRLVTQITLGTEKCAESPRPSDFGLSYLRRIFQRV